MEEKFIQLKDVEPTHISSNTEFDVNMKLLLIITILLLLLLYTSIYNVHTISNGTERGTAMHQSMDVITP